MGPDKNIILHNLQYGFRADWAPEMPPNNSFPTNFLKGEEAIQKARDRFVKEVQKGQMLGGVGWSLRKVKQFLKRNVYIIPCGAVAKNDDPFGRIIHNYG